jgi:hypothetical protein
MQLTNFRIVEGRWNIEISALDKVWNLHDAYYLGLRHSFAHDANGFITGNWVELSWQVDPARYSASGFSLVFNGVDFFEVTPRDDEMPAGEDTCLSSVAEMPSSEVTSEWKAQGFLAAFNPDGTLPDADEYHLYFIFRGGQTVRIGCHMAEFVVAA